MHLLRFLLFEFLWLLVNIKSWILFELVKSRDKYQENKPSPFFPSRIPQNHRSNWSLQQMWNEPKHVLFTHWREGVVKPRATSACLHTVFNSAWRKILVFKKNKNFAKHGVSKSQPPFCHEDLRSVGDSSKERQAINSPKWGRVVQVEVHGK